MQRRGTRPRRLWVGAVLAPLMVSKSFAAVTLAAVAGLAVLVLVLVIVAVALGSTFAPARRGDAPASKLSRHCCNWPRGRATVTAAR